MRASSRQGKMDGNNMHASVVIKFPEEEKADDLKACKLDLEDAEASKGYVIDQLFSNDEIAVYAMFELPTFDIEKPPKSLKKLSCSNFGEFRFPQRRTYAEKKDQAIRSGKATLIDSKEEPAALWQLRSEKNFREENFSGVEKTNKHVKLKSTSKGVNTDIDQSPRLLEEVRKAISMNFSKFSEKTMELSSFFSEKSSQDVKEITAVNSSVFSLDGKNGKHGEKSFPNIVMVPIILKNEDLHNFLKDENSQESPNFSQILDSKTSMVLQKVSVSTSTELSLVQHKNNQEPQTLQNKPYNNEKANQRKEKAKSQEYLLEEIKNLQEQFNTLLKSLESIGFNFAKKIGTKDITAEPEEPKPVYKTLNKFDELPIFSREICVFSEPKNCNGKIIDVEIEEEEVPNASNSKSFTKDNISNKDMIDEYAVNWKEFQKHKETQKSRSQTNVRYAAARNTNLKKSFSVDLSKESLKSKKLDTMLLKFEGRVKKKNKSIRLNEELVLVDKPNEPKLQESTKFESLEVKPTINDFNNKAVVNGLLKIPKCQLNKDLEKGIPEKTVPSRMLTRASNAEPSDKAKKAGLRNKTTEMVKLETKVTPSQEKKQNLKFIRRVSVKDSAQSKLHVNLLIKSQQNCEQKKYIPVKGNSTRLPRANFQKKDETMTKKEKSPEAEPISALKMSVKQDTSETETPEDKHPETPMVVLELFSKKPPSIEDLNSEVNLQCQYGSNAYAEENSGSGKNDNSDNCQNAVVKSVWALKKFFLYEDGKKKMEVLEASPNPPDYCLNQNSTEDKIR